MATSSILGGTQLPEDISGKDLQALGPSDNSDSGSDAVGAYGDDEMSSDSDAAGTGERASAGIGNDQLDADILPDHIDKALGVDTDLDEEAIDDLENDVDDLDAVDGLAGDSDDPEAEAEAGDEDDGGSASSSAH